MAGLLGGEQVRRAPVQIGGPCRFRSDPRDEKTLITIACAWPLTPESTASKPPPGSFRPLCPRRANGCGAPSNKVLPGCWNGAAPPALPAQNLPEKQYYPASEEAICQYLKKIALEKVWQSLEEDVYEVKVPGEIAAKARLAIERMLQLA